ncbi:ABC transporter permease subunit [Jatrophihabitans sp.]|uniref:ABC transporter permease n=1 Tax=Jatrophihabitans sp. TaxID=1932789 RepID=UPI0030C76C17|nr:binding-protein-dependent transport system inner rane component [Jatrophihabitans sp.]
MTAVLTPTVASIDPGLSEAAGSVGKAVTKRLVQAGLMVVVSLIVLIFLWWAGLKLFGIDPLVGKTPADVWNYFFNAHPKLGVRPQSMSPAQARSEALHGLQTTLADAGLGFFVGLFVSAVIASLFVLFQPFEFAFMPVALLLRSVPLVAMAPLILLIFGHTKTANTLVGTIVVLFPALINMVLGLRSAPPEAIDVIRVNGGGKWMTLLRVQIPSALPNFFAAVRISVPGAMVGAMLAESISGFDGFGGLISTAHGLGHSTEVWALAFIGVVVSIVLYAVVTVIESAVLAAWGPNAGRR